MAHLTEMLLEEDMSHSNPNRMKNRLAKLEAKYAHITGHYEDYLSDKPFHWSKDYTDLELKIIKKLTDEYNRLIQSMDFTDYSKHLGVKCD